MKIVSILFILFFIVSCKQEIDRHLLVKVGNFSDQIELDSIISDIRLLKLNTPDTNFIGQIKDVAICNDSIYILDEIKQSLFIFDIHGNFIKEACYLGRAGGEYINAFSIECDSSNVYVLDMPGKKLLVYDRLLNFIEQKNLPHSSSDFKIFNKYFVFNNIEDINGNYYFSCMDADMKMLDKLIPYDRKSGHTLHGRGTGQMIAWNENMKFISLVRPFSNHVYKMIPGEKLQSLYRIDFGVNTIPERGTNAIDLSRTNFIYIEDFFDLGQYKVVSFFGKEKRYYCIFTPEREVLYAGRVRDSETHLPFFPRWQYRNKLIGTCRGEYVKDYMEGKQDKLNQDDLEKNYLIFYSID